MSHIDKEERSQPRIAVLIPCYNEEVTITKVIHDFRSALPDADIYVYDNNSTDRTAEIARATGAIVRYEKRQGKGNVIRSMFRDIDADFYVMTDGDDTYDAGLAISMVKLAVESHYDVVNCVRKGSESQAYRPSHVLGNKILTKAVNAIFGNYIEDMLSGYKVLSRRFVKSFPIQSMGFDIETEIAIHALQLQIPIGHIEGNYYARSPGSESKLRTVYDGFKILKLIISLFRHEKPLPFFSLIGSILVIISLALGIPVIYHFIETGLVPKLPTAVLSMGIMLVAFLSFMTGIILDTVTKGRIENKMIAYLQNKKFDL
jgi:glycosyltransferase involved in cell wall biosynthesis